MVLRRSIFSRCLRFARVFSRGDHAVEGWVSSFSLQKKFFCTRLDIPAGQGDFTVSFLANSCGLSREAAIEASHKVKLQSLQKPDSVLALLREYEFSDTQISTLVRKHPQVILADAQKTLLPKLEFFSSIGMSRLDLAKTLIYNPTLLSRSLKNRIVPTYTFLKKVVIFDLNVVKILKNNSSIFRVNLSSNVVPNIQLLTELGMPPSVIVQLLTFYTRIITRKTQLFSQLVGQVEEMGFDPRKSSFVPAMVALSAKETAWKRCEDAYSRWGWSDTDILSAFKLSPLCMTKSEEKIMATMDFLVNKMGWQSRTIAKYPRVLCHSLEKRIIPRFSVVRVLVLKGLIEDGRFSLSTVLCPSEELFLKKFLTANISQVPQLWDVYHGKVDMQDV